MNLKTYRGRHVADVLSRIHQELGQDAQILHTRMGREGGVLGLGSRPVIEITAAAKAGERAGASASKEPTANSTPACHARLLAALQAAQHARARRLAEQASRPASAASLLTTEPVAKTPSSSGSHHPVMNSQPMTTHGELLRAAAEEIAVRQAERFALELTMCLHGVRSAEILAVSDPFMSAWKRVLDRHRYASGDDRRISTEPEFESRMLTVACGRTQETADCLIARVLIARLRGETGGATVLDCTGASDSAGIVVRQFAASTGVSWRQVSESDAIADVLHDVDGRSTVILRVGGPEQISHGVSARLLDLWEGTGLRTRFLYAGEVGDETGSLTLGLHPVRTARRLVISLEERLGLSVVLQGTVIARRRLDGQRAA